MATQNLIRIFTRGGVISPGDLLKIIHTANDLGTDYLYLGSRQDILFPVLETNIILVDRVTKSISLDYDFNDNVRQNILSSYVAQDVMPSKKWLAPHIYHYILETFDYQPKIRINIVDPSQSLVPLFTGKVNFIASSMDNFWYVYLRFDDIDKKLWRFPVLVYGFDLYKLAQAIEIAYFNNSLDYEDIYANVLKDLKLNVQSIQEDLVYPDGNFPYYEGMNRISDGRYWLGLYWRNNKFETKFLKALCERCLETSVGKISITPWKSLIVKPISENDRVGWEKLLGGFGINMRHSSLELNWHLPAMDEEAIQLRSYLVRELDEIDISTYGLTFSIKTSRDMTIFTSVVIEINELEENSTVKTYNILYTEDFNPNQTEYQYYAQNIRKEIIPPLLVELSYRYYDQINESKVVEKKYKSDSGSTQQVYQCKSCLTQFDERIGDSSADIQPGISFEELPAEYSCPLCGSDKSSFEKITS